MRLTFKGGKDFHQELRRRVDAWFSETGRRKRDNPAMYLKSAIILAVFFTTYGLLVFAAQAWWQAVPLTVLLGLATAGIGFNIEHDGGHNAYSSRRWVNRLSAFTLDMIGGSSYLWRWKHAVFHHTYVNIKGFDADIDLGTIARLSPHHHRFAHQRFQHWYAWPLYGVMAMKWHFYDDFRDLVIGRMGALPFARPRGRDLFVLLAGKLVFFTLAFGIPLLVHSFAAVAVFYALTAAVTGVTLSVVFQLAHCVEDAAFVEPEAGSDEIANAWAIHQAESTVNFARDSRLAAWYLGGLNFQIEHHLLPGICHVNYPALAPLVKQVCTEYGVRYTEYPSFARGVSA
ncbi:MAG TPA: acyl-CoA desaturase, partial [Gammaproteobacteria bacterium]